MVTVEVRTFQKPTLPDGFLTTHVRVEVDEKLARVYEENGWGGKDCPRLALENVISSVKIDASKIFRRTEYGYRKKIKNVDEVMKKLNMNASAVYKPNAHEIKMCEKIGKDSYFGIQDFVGMVGAVLIWRKKDVQ